MKNFCYLLSILLLNFYARAAEANKYIGLTNLSDVHLSDVNITGSANLDNVTLSSARIIGPLQFKKLTVSGNASIIGPVNGSFGKFDKLEVTGPLSLQNSEINSLKVIGQAHFKNVNIKNDTVIIGNLEAEKSLLHDITITVNNIKLSETKAHNITIKDNSQEPYLKGVQVLEIKNKTIISGDIIFESKLGKVLLSKDSKINGKVIGAEVQNLKN